MAAARAAFEAGLRLAWINAPQDPQERAIRVLLIHSSQAKWKRTVASDYDVTGAGGDRWRQAAEAQENLVSRALDKTGSPELPKRVPPVAEQLRELNVDRLYSVPTRTIAYDQPGIEVESLYRIDGQRMLYLLRPFVIGTACPKCRNWSTFHIDGNANRKVALRA